MSSPRNGFDNGAPSKIDDVLAEDGEILQVLHLVFHLKCFFDGQVGGTML